MVHGSSPDGWEDPQVGIRHSFSSQAQYRQGLELSKQAAQLGAAEEGAGETGLPDLAAFSSTQQAFQARLTHFYMAAERQRTDLETLLHLHRFRRKVRELPGPSAQSSILPLGWHRVGAGLDTTLGTCESHPHRGERCDMGHAQVLLQERRNGGFLYPSRHGEGRSI